MSHLQRTTVDRDPALPVLWQLELSHYNEKVRWALDYKRIPHIRRSLLPGPHIETAKSLTGDTSTTPVLTVDGHSIGDSTRIIAAIEERWPQPPLYPEDQAQRSRALELEEFFDEELGPHIRRAMYHALLPHPELLLPRFTHGQPLPRRTLLEAGFPALQAAMRRRMDINPETAALIWPLAAETQEHRDDLMFRIGMGVAFVVMAGRIAHHDDDRRISAEIGIELLLDQTPEPRTEKIVDRRREPGSVAKTGQTVTSAIGNAWRIGEHLILQIRGDRVFDECEIIRVAAQLGRRDRRFVKQRERSIDAPAAIAGPRLHVANP